MLGYFAGGVAGEDHPVIVGDVKASMAGMTAAGILRPRATKRRPLRLLALWPPGPQPS
jgi:hypothetical protein